MAAEEVRRSVEFSKNLRTPTDLPAVELWSEDHCEFMERGKVLTRIRNKVCCFLVRRSTTWHLCYIIRTNDDALIIFTSRQKGQQL
ncbi:unnamed protein product [Gongylonema pulchrum]|uniref:SH2 domain-containing protein n=1 Tax=Gongylonema pulchrum TaxID=637853 RepID=A0A183DFE2_9BILA|nr:unnamed protein product [Gongylonema pulchrum]